MYESGAGMNTFRIVKKIESNNIYIDGLDKYIGKDDEIIVLIEDEKTSAWPDNFFKETYGFMKSEKISRFPQGDISERINLK